MHCFAQQTSLSVREEGVEYYISMAMRNSSTEKLIASIQEGYTAEISFQIRIYKKITGMFSLFGDRMIAEYHPTYEARWDLFNNHFTIIDEQDEPHVYSSRERFLDHFLQLTDFSITFDKQKDQEYYIMSNVRLNTMKLVPPLTLLAPFLSGRGESSNWVRKPIFSGNSSAPSNNRKGEGKHPG